MYSEDLVYVHHEGFTNYVRAVSPGLLRMLRHGGVRAGTVVDLGCGSGVLLNELDKAGFRPVGVDASSAFLEVARGIAPAAILTTGSLYKVRLPACDAVTSIGEVLSYDPPGSRPRRSLAPLFRRVAAALKQGGLFVFDLLVTGVPALDSRIWRVGDTWAVLGEGHEEIDRRRLTRRITTFRKAGASYRRREERHILTVFDRRDVETWLRKAGFSVRVSKRFGGVPIPPRRLVFRARKR